VRGNKQIVGAYKLIKTKKPSNSLSKKNVVNTKLKIACVLPDVHIPYQDKASLKLAEAIMNYVKPDQIVQVGDLVDFYPVSRYTKDPDRASGVHLQKELDEASSIIHKWAELAPVTILSGNHEARLDKYLVEKAPGLKGLRSLNVQSLLGVDDKKVSYKEFMYLGRLFISHGDRVSKGGCAHSAMTAKSNIEKMNCDVMLGHIHRLGAFYRKTRGGGDQAGFEIGCLCERETVEYLPEPNWQHGMAVVHYRNDGNKDYNAQLIHIKSHGKTGNKRRAIYDGKIFEC